MDEAKIQRINQLSRLAKERELTPAEQEERAALRAEYVAAFRASLVGALEHTTIRYPDGSEKKPTRKNPYH